jgi:hypothetical protein
VRDVAVVTALATTSALVLLLGSDAVGRFVADWPHVRAFGWTGLAIAFLVRARSDRDHIDPWRGLALIGVASADVLASLADDGGGAWTGAHGGVLVVAMALAVVGTSKGLLTAYLDQRRAMEALGLAAQEADVVARVRRHDVSNALTALGGAALTLERYHERMQSDDREALTRSLTKEVARLQAVMADARRPTAVFALHETVPAAAAAVSVDGELCAVGDVEATSRAVQALLAHATSRTDKVSIRALRDGDWAVLRVEDQGPVPSRTERQALVADHDAPVGAAARAMRAQGGDVWIDVHRGRTSYCICLPIALGQERTAG